MRGGEYIIPVIVLVVVIALAVLSRRRSATPARPPSGEHWEETAESSGDAPAKPLGSPVGPHGLNFIARLAERAHDRLVDKADKARRE
jgi:hypothetical protein